MATNDFVGMYSTNDIWRDNDSSRCLTDDLNAMDEIYASLSDTYAAKDHAHSEYALVNHAHDEYAAKNHTHDDYFSVNGGTINGDVTVTGTLNAAVIQELKDKLIKLNATVQDIKSELDAIKDIKSELESELSVVKDELDELKNSLKTNDVAEDTKASEGTTSTEEPAASDSDVTSKDTADSSKTA